MYCTLRFFIFSGLTTLFIPNSMGDTACFRHLQEAFFCKSGENLPALPVDYIDFSFFRRYLGRTEPAGRIQGNVSRVFRLT